MRTTTLFMAVVLVMMTVLIAGCTPKAACTGQQVKIGTVCCNDADSNGVCDEKTAQPVPAQTAPVTKPSVTPADTVTAPTPALKARSLDEVEAALERYLNYYVVWKKDYLPANHYMPIDNSYFTVYGSPGIDLLVVKDEKNYFNDWTSFEELMTRVRNERMVYTRNLLKKDETNNKTFTQWVDLNTISQPSGRLLEYRDRAEIDLHGANDRGSPYVDPIEPWGVVTIYIPCKPNVIVAFSSVKQPSQFVGNYEGEEYRSELEKSLNELSNEQMFKAVKLFSACKMD